VSGTAGIGKSTVVEILRAHVSEVGLSSLVPREASIRMAPSQVGAR
jgi:thymidylate kinase